MFRQLTCHTFKAYGQKYSASWISRRVVDGISHHNPPMRICLPNVESPRSIVDLIQIEDQATVELVVFMLRMWQLGRNGYDCLRDKLAEIEQLLMRQGNYSANDIHKALFLYPLLKKDPDYAHARDQIESQVVEGDPSTDHLAAMQPSTCLRNVHVGGPDEIRS